MNIFKLRSLLALSMMQFILGPVEVATFDGDIELTSGTVGQIRRAISIALGIQEWSLILVRETEILDDSTMKIRNGKLNIAVSNDPERFIRWNLEEHPMYKRMEPLVVNIERKMGPVEVATFAGDILELASGTVAQIRKVVSAALGIQEWSLILVRETEILDDSRMKIRNGKLNIAVSNDPERFIRWNLEKYPINKRIEPLAVNVELENTKRGPEFKVRINTRYSPNCSMNFPASRAELPSIFRIVSDVRPADLIEEDLAPSKRQDITDKLSEVHKDDPIMLAMIAFINEGFTINRRKPRFTVKTDGALECYFRGDLWGDPTFQGAVRFIEILMGNCSTQ